jgi:hypothetical protein
VNLLDILTLAGLLLGTIGGALLAYDPILGAGKRFQADVLQNQLASVRNLRAMQRRVIEGLPGNWTKAERDAEFEKEEAEWGPREADLAKKAQEAKPKFEDRVVAFGTIGLLLIIGSFALQAASLILHIVAESSPH